MYLSDDPSIIQKVVQSQQPNRVVLAWNRAKRKKTTYCQALLYTEAINRQFRQQIDAVPSHNPEVASLLVQLWNETVTRRVGP